MGTGGPKSADAPQRRSDGSCPPLLSRPILVFQILSGIESSHFCAPHTDPASHPHAQHLQPEACLTAIATFDQMNKVTKKYDCIVNGRNLRDPGSFLTRNSLFGCPEQ